MRVLYSFLINKMLHLQVLINKNMKLSRKQTYYSSNMTNELLRIRLNYWKVPCYTSTYALWGRSVTGYTYNSHARFTVSSIFYVEFLPRFLQARFGWCQTCGTAALLHRGPLSSATIWSYLHAKCSPGVIVSQTVTVLCPNVHAW